MRPIVTFTQLAPRVLHGSAFIYMYSVFFASFQMEEGLGNEASVSYDACLFVSEK